MTTPQKNESVSTRQEAEAYYAEIRDDRNFASSNLSAQIRTTILAILALTWLLLNGTQAVLEKKFGCFSSLLMWLAALCICALVADFLQGVFAVYETNKAANLSADALSDGRFDDVGYDESPLRLASTGLYIGKCAMVVVAGAWLVIIIFRALNDSCLRVCS